MQLSMLIETLTLYFLKNNYGFDNAIGCDFIFNDNMMWPVWDEETNDRTIDF